MSNGNDIGFIMAQLTIANWYLDRAQGVDVETARRYISRARQAHELLLQILAELAPGAAQHGDVRTGLTLLQDRLNRSG